MRLDISMLGTWFLQGGGYVDQFDEWVSTGVYTCYRYVWEGAVATAPCEGFQPGNYVKLEMKVNRWGRGDWSCTGLTASYRRGYEVKIGMEGEDWFHARTLAQLQRKAMFRWREYGSLADVFSAAYAPHLRSQVFKEIGGQWVPFASTWHNIGGIESPGTPLGFGSFLIKQTGEKFHTLNVSWHGTGGCYGGTAKVDESQLWLEKIPA